MNNLMPSCMHMTRWPQLPLAGASAIGPFWQCPQLLLPACSCHNSRDSMPQGPCMFTLLRRPPPTSPLLQAFFTGRSIPYGCVVWICAMASLKASLPTGSPETHPGTFRSHFNQESSKSIPSVRLLVQELRAYTSGTKDHGRSTIYLQIKVYRLQLKKKLHENMSLHLNTITHCIYCLIW